MLQKLFQEIGKIVFVTSSELQSPGLDVVLIDKLGLPRNVSRDSVNFKGCGGGLSGLALINDYCIANPGNKVTVGKNARTSKTKNREHVNFFGFMDVSYGIN